MQIFSDTSNKYVLLDYSLTHQQLLLRSLRNPARNYNIDILFKMVAGIMIPTTLNGVTISATAIDAAPDNVMQRLGLTSSYNKSFFTLHDAAGGEFYINAGAFGVFHNELDILETSLGRYDMGSRGEILFWYRDDGSMTKYE